jgi:hypothetical protein
MNKYEETQNIQRGISNINGLFLFQNQKNLIHSESLIEILLNSLANIQDYQDQCITKV